MPNIPTVGVFIPNGYLNLGSSAGPSGQQDAYGNIYPSGLCPGKVIEVNASEAASVAAPGTALYDGAYQYVLLDSGATASLATQGLAAFIRLDSGATQGALPMTSFENGTVTTADQANTLGGADTAVFAGVFVNPATFKGQSNAPTPGQYCFLFVGAGRATVTYNGSATAGQNVLPVAPTSAQTGQFAPGAAAASTYPNGIALTTTSGAGSQGVALWQDLIYRISNQGV
jgi:hypothetical protein